MVQIRGCGDVDQLDSIVRQHLTVIAECLYAVHVEFHRFVVADIAEYIGKIAIKMSTTGVA